MKRRAARCAHRRTAWRISTYHHLPDGPPIRCGWAAVYLGCGMAFAEGVAERRGVLPTSEAKLREGVQ